jgi:hypothetical protein
MAIVLGLALALQRDRAPAALVNFMGVYWMLNGIVTLQWGLAVEDRRRRLPLSAHARSRSARSRLPGSRASVLLSDALLMRRRLLAHPDGHMSEERAQ